MMIQLLERFWKKVKRGAPDDCWPWQGSRTQGQYGQMASGGYRRSKATRILATHISLAIDNRFRPSPQHVAMHLCDNPICVNPKHLQWGTLIENHRDMVMKERSAAQKRAIAAMDEAATDLRLPIRNTKMTPDLVRMIRASPKTTIALAAELQVTNQCISSIRTRKTWRHIE